MFFLFILGVVTFDLSVTSPSITNGQILPRHGLAPYFIQYYDFEGDVQSLEIHINQSERKSVNEDPSSSVRGTVVNTLYETSAQGEMNEIYDDCALNNDLVRKPFDILPDLLHKVSFHTRNIWDLCASKV